MKCSECGKTAKSLNKSDGGQCPDCGAPLEKSGKGGLIRK